MTSTARSFRATIPLLLVSLALALNAAPAGRDDDGYPRLMQGPMVGAVSDHGVKIWLRTSGEYRVTLEYDTDFEMDAPELTDPAMALKANDYTLMVEIDGLDPATTYYYRVLVNGKGDRYLREHPPFRFTTAPPEGAAASFRIAFGSCPKYQDDRIQPIWWVIPGLEPDLFFWIGDNIYGDTLDPDILREEYRRQRDVPGVLPVIRNVPNLAIWDDHDFALNNHDRTNPIREPSLEVFKQYWPNPAFGLPDVPGVFFSYSYGGVDFFFLDGRYHRDPDADPDTPDKTMLGRDQFEWLVSGLEASDAVFKVIVSGGGFTIAKGEGGDSWAGFLNERDRLFDLIRGRKISGVVLLSGDSHLGELNVIPWSERGGYDFYELVSSPLAQRTPDDFLYRRPERRIRPVYFRGSNVGVVDFMMDEPPRLIFRLIDIYGRSVWEPFVLRADELVNGITSWPEKVDPEEAQRQQNYDGGKGYYELEPED